ncbi:MAG: formimidoylglutamase [Legionellaceae bacterium]|nr:formimidoylglutamase [Legionellaceae bacterium]
MLNLLSLYKPIEDKQVWSGRNDGAEDDYLYQIIKFIDLDNIDGDIIPGYAILGFESDEGVRRNLGRQGAKDGPMAFRKAAGQLPVQQDTVIYDAGNVACLDNDLEAAQEELKNRVESILSLGLMPVIIGGGHETALGHYQGISNYYAHESVAILNFDAHFDLRELGSEKKGSSGTPFRQINNELQAQKKPFYYYCAGIQPCSNTKSLFSYANENHVHYELAETIAVEPHDTTWIENIVKKHKHIYVSVCLDVFSSAIAPGVSAPQTLGIDIYYVLNAIRILKSSGCVVSFDIVELAPRYDMAGQTAKLAGALFFNYCMVK